MPRLQRDFFNRDESERSWMIESTWCDTCGLPDLGIENPMEFEEDGHVYIEGSCRICGRRLMTEVVDQRAETSLG